LDDVAVLVEARRQTNGRSELQAPQVDAGVDPLLDALGPVPGRPPPLRREDCGVVGGCKTRRRRITEEEEEDCVRSSAIHGQHKQFAW
jgi:hypothetical protein